MTAVDVDRAVDIGMFLPHTSIRAAGKLAAAAAALSLLCAFIVAVSSHGAASPVGLIAVFGAFLVMVAFVYLIGILNAFPPRGA